MTPRRLWRCGCGLLNAPGRASCRGCRKAPASEAERQAFGQVVLTILLAERTAAKASLDEAVGEEKRLLAEAKMLERQARKVAQ